MNVKIFNLLFGHLLGGLNLGHKIKYVCFM